LIDKEQISVMVRDVERYLSDLKEIGVSDKKDLEEKEKYYAVSMIVFAVMNRAMDIGNEVISGSGNMPMPDSYKETFEVLAHNKIISPGLAAEMMRLMKYRNAIAHEYYQITADELYGLKKDIYKAEKFISEIKKYLEKK
jgi:uncharacterized protein YutE (UPF0331/DUF86 family)